MTPSEGPAGRDERPDDLDDLVQRLGSIAGSLQRLVDVQFERARVEFRDRSFRAVGWVFFVLFLLALTITSALLLSRGLTQFLTSLFGGRAWAGDLTAAALILALAVVSGIVVRAGLRRRHLRRMRQKFEPHTAESREAG